MKRKKAPPPQRSEMEKVQRRWQQLALDTGLRGPFDYAARADGERRARMLFREIAATHRTYHHDAEMEAIIEFSRAQYEQFLEAAYPPGFWEEFERLRAGNAAGLESAIAFLEADPIFHRSGYVKRKLMRAIKPHFLTPDDTRRVQNLVLSLADRRDDRDFRDFCNLARKVDGPELRTQLEQRLGPGDADARRRARWMLKALEEGGTYR